jgi:hypothetical protein
MKPVIWSEDLPFPYICDYHKKGCQCRSPEGIPDPVAIMAGISPNTCDYCSWGCQCDADDWEEPGDGGYDEKPACECDCQCCTCEENCDCEPLLVDADSFNDWVAEVCHVCNAECLDDIPLSEEGFYCIEKLGGGYEFAVRTVPTASKRRLYVLGVPSDIVRHTRNTFDIYQGMQKSELNFTGTVMVPTLKGPTPGGAKPVWMSLTPMEVFTLREGIEKAHGRVLCAGLGLGWLTLKMLEKPEVEHITQIEISPEVIEFSGVPLAERFPGKIDFICGDALDYVESTDLSKYDSIIFDIWVKYWSANLDPRFQKLKTLHPNVWGWGDY